MTYYLVFLTGTFLSIHDLVSNRSIMRKVLFLYFSVLLIVLASIRNEVGTDWFSYLNIYEKPTNFQSVEIGYKYLSDLFSRLNLGFNSLQLALATLSMSLICFFMGKNVKYYSLALLIYFSDVYLYYNLSGVRQALAISFLLVSTHFLIRNMKFKFFLFVGIATLFHISAILFCLAILVPHAIQNKGRLRLFVILSVVVFLGFSALIQIITSFDLGNTINYYLSDGYNNPTWSNFLVGLIKRLWPVFLILYLIYFEKFKLSHELKLMAFLYLIGVYLFGLIYMYFPDTAVRISSYFIVFDFVLVTSFFYACRNAIVKWVLFLVTLGLVFYKVHTYATISAYGYKTII